MKRTFVTKSGRIYTINDSYPRISEEEGQRRQKDAVMCIVRIIREKSVGDNRKSTS